MSRSDDRKMKKLADRLVAMSPEPPPYPEEVSVTQREDSKPRPVLVFAGRSRGVAPGRHPLFLQGEGRGRPGGVVDDLDGAHHGDHPAPGLDDGHHGATGDDYDGAGDHDTYSSRGRSGGSCARCRHRRTRSRGIQPWSPSGVLPGENHCMAGGGSMP